MARTRKPKIQKTTIHIQDRGDHTIEYYVDGNGWFNAEVLGQEIQTETLKALKDAAIEIIQPTLSVTWARYLRVHYETWVQGKYGGGRDGLFPWMPKPPGTKVRGVDFEFDVMDVSSIYQQDGHPRRLARWLHECDDGSLTTGHETQWGGDVDKLIPFTRERYNALKRISAALDTIDDRMRDLVNQEGAAAGEILDGIGVVGLLGLADGGTDVDDDLDIIDIEPTDEGPSGHSR